MTLRADSREVVSPESTPRPFAEGFLFGVAAAASPIEGAAREEGSADSIWGAFARVPGDRDRRTS